MWTSVSSIPSIRADMNENLASSNGDEFSAQTRCVSRSVYEHLLSRDERASISRPYFQHWRAAREMPRIINGKSLPFSPRLGKRNLNDDQFFEKKYAEDSASYSHYSLTVDGIIGDDQLNVVYEDPKRICISKLTIGDGFEDLLKKFNMNEIIYQKD